MQEIKTMPSAILDMALWLVVEWWQSNNQLDFYGQMETFNMDENEVILKLYVLIE